MTLTLNERSPSDGIEIGTKGSNFHLQVNRSRVPGKIIIFHHAFCKQTYVLEDQFSNQWLRASLEPDVIDVRDGKMVKVHLKKPFTQY
jgi:hypothetical protein